MGSDERRFEKCEEASDARQRLNGALFESCARARSATERTLGGPGCSIRHELHRARTRAPTCRSARLLTPEAENKGGLRTAPLPQARARDRKRESGGGAFEAPLPFIIAPAAAWEAGRCQLGSRSVSAGFARRGERSLGHSWYHLSLDRQTRRCAMERKRHSKIVSAG